MAKYKPTMNKSPPKMMPKLPAPPVGFVVEVDHLTAFAMFARVQVEADVVAAKLSADGIQPSSQSF